MDELRKYERFSDFGRVECKRLCAFPGILCDVSHSGLKTIFDADVSLHFDESFENESVTDEYELLLHLPRESISLRLLAIPVWKYDERRTSRTHIGFSLLPALDFPLYSKYVDGFEESADDFDLLGIGDEDWARKTVSDVVDALCGNRVFEPRLSCQMI